MKRAELTPRQREAVESRDARLLVVGGAGTGKTTLALWLARTELDRPENASKRALFLTFSRTAVDQIASRSKSVVAPVEKRIEVSTFHSFAYRLVSRFGHVAGVTGRNPSVQSASEAKLLGKAPDRLVYDDLLPLALRILEHPAVARLLARRWCLVICDEFQDTGHEQWALLRRLEANSRVVLLGDENQLIFGFLAPKGVGPARMTAAESWADCVVELEESSHRDPTGAIPALATAIRQRQFSDPAVTAAIRSGRLRIRDGVDGDAVVSVIGQALDEAWERGCRTFGVFAHSNQSVAELSFRLSEAGIDHYLVGLPDAEADALASMLSLTKYAYGEVDWGGAMTALGTFLTACSRGNPPPLAQALASGTPLPTRLQERLDDLRSELIDAADRSLPDVAEVAVSSWTTLGILAGNAPWGRTAPSFSALARRFGGSTEARIAQLDDAVRQVRATAMFESQSRRAPAVQVMNLHQTKGREADAVVALFDDNDFHGREDEPFAEASRLLYVVMTRARREITAILGHEPHPLVAPLRRLS